MQKYVVHDSAERIKFISVIVLALIVNLIALWPLLSTGYIGDDYPNSLTPGVLRYNNIGLIDMTWSISKGWLQGQGRLFPLASYGYALFNTVQNLFLYKLGSLLSVIIAFSLFSRFIYRLSGDRNLALLIAFLPSLFIQFRNWHDPVLSYTYLLPLMFIYILTSFILFLRFIDEGGGRLILIGSVLFFVMALLTYEVSFAYIAVVPFIAYWKLKDIRKSIVLSFPFILCTLIVLAISAYARSIATGIDPIYKISFSSKTYFTSLWGHVLASFPLIYSWNHVYLLDAHGIKSALLGADIPAYSASLCLGISITLLALRIKLQEMSKLFIVAFLFLLLPLCLIVLSVKHQNLPIGVGYLPVFCAYAGAMMLMVLGIVTVLRFLINKPALQLLVVSIVGVMMSGMFLINLHANKVVAEALNKSWHYPRNVLEKACRAGLMQDIPEGSRILLTSLANGWDSIELKYLFCQCSGKRFNTLDMASLSTEETGTTERPIGDLYALRHESGSLSQGYVFIGKVKKNHVSGENILKPGVQIIQPDIFYSLDESGSALRTDSSLELCKHVLSKREDTLVHYVVKHDAFLSEIVHCDTVYLKNGNAFALDPVHVGKQISIETIIKPVAQQVSYAAIIGNHPGYNYHEGFVIQQDGDRQNVYTFGFGNGKRWLPGVTFNVEPEKWTYLAITVDNHLITVYMDGRKITSADAQDVMQNSAMPLYLFNWIEQNRPFHGLIKEVRISNSTLSPEVIANDWKSDSFAIQQAD